MAVRLEWDAFGAVLEATPDDWDAFAARLGVESTGNIVLELHDVDQLVVSRRGDELLLRGTAQHVANIIEMVRGLADAGRAAGPTPAVLRHGEIEAESYLPWVARGSMPIHLVALPG